MWKKIWISISLAQQNIRARFFHTLLSVLGIVIGVSALVAVLSLIDGLEEFAQDQITQTTSLKAVTVQTNQYKTAHNLRIKKEEYDFLDYSDFVSLKSAISIPADFYLSTQFSGEVTIEGQPIGASIIGQAAPRAAAIRFKIGQAFLEQDIEKAPRVAFVNHSFATQVAGRDSIQKLIGKDIGFRGKSAKVIGVLEEDDTEFAQMFIPITLFSKDELKEHPPRAIIEALHVESVPEIKTEVTDWLRSHYQKDTTDFVVITNEFRVEQAAQGFLLFRVVMGLIVGISVLVGGIGVMNVLLISVNERTVEIGVRKAMGAKRQDILLQFLAESVTVSLFGCFIGLVLGVLGTWVMVPVIKSIVDVPFEAAFTWNTLAVISVAAIVIGIVFGTYPATQAAKLDPVEAIRRE